MDKAELQEYASNMVTKLRAPKPKRRNLKKQTEKPKQRNLKKQLEKQNAKIEKKVKPKQRNLKGKDSNGSQELTELEVKVSNVKELIAFIIVAFFVMYNLIIISQKVMNPENIPDFFGYKNFIISSGSMIPNLNVGDLIITKSNQEIVKGDIITFYEQNAVITHRVVDVVEENGVKKYKTKGDANKSEDNYYVYEENIEGKLSVRVPYIGKFVMFLQSRIGVFVTTLLLLMIFRYIRNEDEYEENWVEELRKLCIK